MACLTYEVSISFVILSLYYVNPGIRCIAPKESKHLSLTLRFSLDNWHRSISRMIRILIIKMVSCKKSQGLSLFHLSYSRLDLEVINPFWKTVKRIKLWERYINTDGLRTSCYFFFNIFPFIFIEKFCLCISKHCWVTLMLHVRSSLLLYWE